MSNPTVHANVMNYLAHNWGASHKRPHALIVNPEAHHLELLAWCWGEVQSLLASADACITANSDINAGDMSAIFMSRLGPLAEVMTIAVDAGMRERSERETAATVGGSRHV